MVCLLVYMLGNQLEKSNIGGVVKRLVSFYWNLQQPATVVILDQIQIN